MRVLLTGATGFVGSYLYPALLAAGYEVLCATRDPSAARARDDSRVWVGLDVEDSSTVEAALAGCDAAYYLVHGLGQGADYPEREARSARNFVEIAARLGVRRIVYLGGVMPEAQCSKHLGSRQRTGEVLRGGGVSTVELRAAMIVGAGSASWTMVRDLAARLPAMLLPRWLRNHSHPVAIDDVVWALIAALTLPQRSSQILELPGPERISHRQVMRRVASLLGHNRLMLNVPVLTPRLSSYWIALVTRVDLALARELVEGVKFDLDPSGRSLWQGAEHEPMGLEQAAALAIADERSEGLPSPDALERMTAIGRQLAAPRVRAREAQRPLARVQAREAQRPSARERSTERRGRAAERASWPALLVLVFGTVLFGAAMAARHVVDPWWSNAATATLVVLACAALLRDELRALLAAPPRAVLVAACVGALMVALTHLAYGAVAPAWPALSERVALLYADIARNQLGVASKVALTLLVVVAEEALWRGVAVSLCQRWLRRPATVVLCVLLYALPQVIGASPILVLAAIAAGTVFTVQRLWTGRLSDPLISHALWSVGVFNLLPLQ